MIFHQLVRSIVKIIVFFSQFEHMMKVARYSYLLSFFFLLDLAISLSTNTMPPKTKASEEQESNSGARENGPNKGAKAGHKRKHARDAKMEHRRWLNEVESKKCRQQKYRESQKER